jgi:hypothetical protein
MDSLDYNLFKRKLENLISSVGCISEDIKDSGGFRAETIREDFEDEIQGIISAMQNCISFLESDETTREFETENEEELNRNEKNYTQKLY